MPPKIPNAKISKVKISKSQSLLATIHNRVLAFQNLDPFGIMAIQNVDQFRISAFGILTRIRLKGFQILNGDAWKVRWCQCYREHKGELPFSYRIPELSIVARISTLLSSYPISYPKIDATVTKVMIVSDSVKRVPTSAIESGELNANATLPLG